MMVIVILIKMIIIKMVNNNNNNNININKKKSTSPGTIMLQHISIGTSVKIMISRLQTNGTNMSQRL